MRRVLNQLWFEGALEDNTIVVGDPMGLVIIRLKDQAAIRILIAAHNAAIHTCLGEV